MCVHKVASVFSFILQYGKASFLKTNIDVCVFLVFSAEHRSHVTTMLLRFLSRGRCFGSVRSTTLDAEHSKRHSHGCRIDHSDARAVAISPPARDPSDGCQGFFRVWLLNVEHPCSHGVGRRSQWDHS